jgi:tetratricopeptide (TPR) repeat protein
MLLPQQPATVAPAVEPVARRTTLWAAAAGATMLIVGLAISFGSTDAAPAAERGVVVRRDAATRQPSATLPVSEEQLAAYETLDTKRAGTAAYNQGDFVGALAEFEAAVDRAPNDPDARNKLGQVLVRQGRAGDALPHFDVAVRLDEGEWSYRFNRARTYGLLNRWDEAVVDYRVAATLFPGDHATLYNLGLALMRVRQYGEASTALEQAVAAAPEQTDFLVSLGTAYVGAQQPAKARATFEAFLERAPSSPEAGRVKELLQAMTDAGQ